MKNVPSAIVVANKLHEIRHLNGLTIQAMAEQCGLPKRSLENYMNMKNPQKPGLEALLSIAESFAVSLDWLTGRAKDNFSMNATKNNYAMACYSTVQNALAEVGIEEGQRAELAAHAMLHFIETVSLFDRSEEWIGQERASYFQTIKSVAEKRKP